MKVAPKSKLTEYFHKLAIAYGLVFDLKGPNVQVVLEDLEAYCCAENTTYSKERSDRELFILEGRRQVWLRIKEFRTKNSQQLLEKYTKPVNVEPNNPQE